MQTNFTAEQLGSPRIAEADKILRRCVHCGLCTATCSTYVLLGDERDSPRGRIYLIKDMLENSRPASDEVSFHIDRCLSCLSCMSTCPSGVDYMHLVDLARVHIEETHQRSPKERLIRNLLAAVVPYPGRFRWALKAAGVGRAFLPLMKAAKLDQLIAMLEMAPKARLSAPQFSGTGITPANCSDPTVKRKRVLMLAGCAQQVLRPEINDATIRLLVRRNVDVEIAEGAGCCGALVLHMGKEKEAIELAKRNVDAWWKVIQNAGAFDGILINASGCGTTVKDYGHLLRNEPDYALKAAHIGAIAKDVSEFLAGHDLGAPVQWSSLRVAYHSACSMQHGQRLTTEPRMLLKKAGFAVVEIPEGHICCGSAGSYNILQPEIAKDLRARKLANIESTTPDLVATGNIGCITQLAMGTDIPIVHTIELLDWAYGGPVPRGLEKFKNRVSSVPVPAAGVLARV